MGILVMSYRLHNNSKGSIVPDSECKFNWLFFMYIIYKLHTWRSEREREREREKERKREICEQGLVAFSLVNGLFWLFRFNNFCYKLSEEFKFLWWLLSYEPSHEIMALFVLRKLILQMRMRSNPVGLDVWFWSDPSSTSIHYVCEQRRLRRVAWAFAVCLCGKYHNLMSWLNYY